MYVRANRYGIEQQYVILQWISRNKEMMTTKKKKKEKEKEKDKVKCQRRVPSNFITAKRIYTYINTKHTKIRALLCPPVVSSTPRPYF